MKRLSVDAVLRLRNAQDTWRGIAENPSIRTSARESAARNVALIEAQLQSNRVSVVLGSSERGVRHG